MQIIYENLLIFFTKNAIIYMNIFHNGGNDYGFY